MHAPRLTQSSPLAPLILAGAFASLTACAPPVFDVPERAASDRTPQTAACDDLDPGRCLLPWPSNRFAVADPATATGLRLSLEAESLNRLDDAESIRRADGFSRVSPILAYSATPLDEGTLGGIHLYVAQPDADDYGREVPLRPEVITVDDGQTLLLADPREVLAANTDYLVVIDESLRTADGDALERPRHAALALGLGDALTEDEAAIAAYHAPARALLGSVGLDPEAVRRVWDFTTRSEEDPRRPLLRARELTLAAVDAGSLGVRIDRVEVPTDRAGIAAIVVGALTGMPTILDPSDGSFTPDAEGLPTALGVSDAPFRVLIPAGDGDYPFVMYGHGTGGHERDNSFDDDLASIGIAKVGVRLYGWTDTDTVTTFARLRETMQGSHAAAAALVEALAHAAAIRRAMLGVIADALSAPMLGGEVNPAAGRRPTEAVPMWVGGSLGGTTGLIFGAADPEVQHVVINVPGAAWSQWVWHSYTFDLIHGLVSSPGHDDIDLNLALSIAQTNLDMADGASWFDVLREHPTTFLLQESMGDPVLPNTGTEIAAITAGAGQVGGVLEPILGVAPLTAPVVGASALTQFRAPPGDVFDVHGFAARDSAAGVAAREQILEFVSSALAGEARIITPPSCPQSCDFGG